jgi:hypothetical protein
MPTILAFIINPKVKQEKLPINLDKSGIRKPVNLTILGYSFVPTYIKGENLAEGVHEHL